MALTGLLLSACNEETTEVDNTPDVIEKTFVQPPVFNADSAYHFVQKQVDFGPRVPNTESHDKAGQWLIDKLKSYTDSVEVQRGVVTAYDKTALRITNIMAHFGPAGGKRILLAAHWDTRPIADEETDPEQQKKPITGANDGASGVAVLLEMARLFAKSPPPTGVTILLVDAEDYGTPSYDQTSNDQNTFCLGTQYWAENYGQIHAAKYKYGIVLDMVGAADAHFLQEGLSVKYAPQVVNKVWSMASKLGYSKYFIFNYTHPLTDDHRYINEMANIPCIDIIDYDAIREQGFHPTWHTHADNITIIDRNTLKAVGHTVMSVIYNEEGV
ncbi:MAG: M28 family peptidase [Bacteroidota bacterium]|nr:M28 family peptidase [Bacteroidota bacterium]